MSASIDRVLRRAVERGDAPFVVAMAGDRDGVIYEGAAGNRRVDTGDAVTPDSMMRIASMTKMVTTVAALQLTEQGSIDLDAPVERYCPEFGAVSVLDGFEGDTPRLRSPATQATVRHLMSHSSGLSYWFWNADIVRWQEITNTPNVMSGRNIIFSAPLVADPGTTFEYGINTDWLGKVVEAVSGLSLDKYLAENVFEPLGMAQTTFLMSEQQRANAVAVHVRGPDGAWIATEVDLSQEPEYWAGGHGLYSTPREYLAFQRMLLGGGALDGTRVLRSSTVDEAFTNQIGDRDFPSAIPTADPQVTADFNIGPGFKFGLGLLLNTEDQPGRRAAGSGAWAGIFNTHFWVDPATGITGAIYTQTLPFVEPPVLQIYIDYESALYDR